MTSDKALKEKKKREKEQEELDEQQLMFALLLEMPVLPEEPEEEPEEEPYDFSEEEQKTLYRAALNGSIAEVVNETRGIRYQFGGKAKSFVDIEDCKGIDCSGFARVAIGHAFRDAGVSDDFIRQLRTSSQGQLNFMKKLGVEVYRENQLTAELMTDKVPMFVAMDTGKKKWDKGRADGIDHVALIYWRKNEKTGQDELYVAQSSGSKGVNDDMPFDKWLKRWDRKNARLFAVDLAEAGIAAKTLELQQNLKLGMETSPADLRRSALTELVENKTGFVDGGVTPTINVGTGATIDLTQDT